MKLRQSIAAFAAAVSAAAQAAETASPPAYSPAGNVLQVLLGLAVVLLVMWAGARLLKRYAAGRQAAAGSLRVLGGVAVGQRERVVMLEVGGTWVLVGVAPGRVNALHVMDRLPDAAPPAAPIPVGPGFAASLARLINRDMQ